MYGFLFGLALHGIGIFEFFVFMGADGLIVFVNLNETTLDGDFLTLECGHGRSKVGFPLMEFASNKLMMMFGNITHIADTGADAFAFAGVVAQEHSIL